MIVYDQQGSQKCCPNESNMINHTLPPSGSRTTWMVKSQSTNESWYVIDHLLTKYTSCSFYKHQCAIILHKNVTKSLLLEYCGSY